MGRRLQVVEICAGAGGQALGLHRAGFDHLVAVEYDATAAGTLAANLAHLDATSERQAARVLVGDVTDPAIWMPDTYAGVDLLAGGPPCPPFSDAGRRLGAADDRDLYAWSIGLVARLKPRAVLLENVKGLSRPRFAGYRQAVSDRLMMLGYVPEWRMVHASDHGLPQTRPRYVLVALRPSDARYFRWPDAEPTTESVGSALHDLMAAAGWSGVDKWAASAAGIGPTIVGGSRKHGGADLGPTGARRRWAALGVNAASVADAPPDATFPEDGIPRLTATMLARLQGFPTGPDGWVFVGRKTAQCRQIGNAFPPPVAEALGRAVAAALRHEGAPRTLTEPVVHCAVLKALTERRGVPVPIGALLDLGLSGRQAAEAIRHLKREFDIVEYGSVDARRFLLKGWRPDVRSHGEHLPLWSAVEDAAA